MRNQINQGMGLIPVDIPTKHYLKAYIQSKLGQKPVMTSTHHIGSKLIDLLNRHENYRRTRYVESAYPVKMRVYITRDAYKNKGGFLNETNIICFNNYIQSYFKEYMRDMLDIYLELTQSLEASIELMREMVGIEEDMFPYELVKKDYYRYRKKKGILLPNGGYKKLVNIRIDPII